MTSSSKYTALLLWARQNGAKIPSSLTFSSEPHGHCRTTEPIASGTALFHIPHSLLITPAVASKALPEATQVPAHARVCAFLGVYRRREGFWKEYLESLPETFSTPPYFDEKEMEILRGTNLYFAWLDRINLWKTEYENVKTFIPELQWDDYLWGATVLSSRSFPSRLITDTTSSSQIESMEYTPSDPILIPVMDMLNHRPNHPVTWLVSPDKITFIAETEYPANVELFNNYGAKGNEELLMGYGFCLEDNPHDSISLKLPGDSTLYMITRNVLCPTPLLEKFRDITAIPREHESESTTRNTFVAYTALIGALLQKMASVGWDERVCDTSAGQQAGIYRASQQDLLMRSYTYIVGLSRTLLEREDGVISNNDCQRRENNGRKRRKLEADDYMSERLALLIHDGGKDFPENVRKGLLSLEEYYRSNRSDDDDEMHADARKIQKRLAKKGVQVSMDDILLAMRIWFEESVKSIIYPDVYKVVARFKGDNAAIEKELTGGPTDLVMFIDEAP